MKYDLQSCIRRYNAGEMLEYVFFWGHHSKSGQVTKACFSQWYPCAFEVDGITYNCAEQYMMAEKARVFNDEEVLSKILVTSNPKDIKALGREVKNFDAMKWSSVSKDKAAACLILRWFPPPRGSCRPDGFPSRSITPACTTACIRTAPSYGSL